MMVGRRTLERWARIVGIILKPEDKLSDKTLVNLTVALDQAWQEGRQLGPGELLFGDIVVVDTNQIGVVVKSWEASSNGNPPHYEVYVRSYNAIKEYSEDDVARYRVRHKYLDDEELGYQHG